MILPDTYRIEFVVASILIAVLTAYAAMSTSSMIRDYSPRTVQHWGWILVSAACLGGGIWAMHFVAMLGYVLPIPVNYNVLLTIASLLLPILVAIPGFYIAFQEKKLTWTRNLMIGTIYGIAIVGMHYTGMAAMDMKAYIDWDMTYVILSVMVAVIAATASIRASFIQLSFIPAIAGSVLMGIAISGMHYTAMCAVTVVGDQSIQVSSPEAIVTRTSLGVGVIVLAFGILLTGLIFAGQHRRIH